MTTLTIAGDPAQRPPCIFFDASVFVNRMARVILGKADYYRLLAILTMP